VLDFTRKKLMEKRSGTSPYAFVESGLIQYHLSSLGVEFSGCQNPRVNPQREDGLSMSEMKGRILCSLI